MRKGIGLAAAVLAGLTAGGAVMAASPADMIKARQEKMKELGGHMKALGEAAKAGGLDAKDVAARAAAMQDSAGKIPDWFPAGTGAEAGVETAAKPEIWAQPAEFKAAAAKMGDLAAALGKAAGGGDTDAMGAALKALGPDGCGNCHKPFKVKKD